MNYSTGHYPQEEAGRYTSMALFRPDKDAQAYYDGLLKAAEENPWGYMSSGGVPQKFVDVKASIEDFKLDIPDQPRSTFIYGPVGTGKSHLAAGLLAHWMPHTFRYNMPSFQWLYWPDVVLEMLKWEYYDCSRGVALLVLDDICRPVRADHLVKLRQVINSRWEKNLPTIVTSNANLSDWHVIDPRISSRLSDGLVVELKGEDRRVSRGRRVEEE